DIASLVVEIQGEGNIKTLAAPALPPLENVEVHDPSENAEYATPAGRLSGTKRFRWLLVPRALGALEIPPIRFAWFDTEAGEYRESDTEPLRLEVVAGGVVGDATLAPIERVPRPAPGPVSLAWVLLLLPPLALVAGAAVVRRRRLGTPTPSRVWRDALARAAAQAGPGRTEWAASVASTVREAAGAATRETELRGASPAELAAALRRSGVRRELADEAGSLVGELERLRFEPGADGADAEALLVRARRLVDALAKGVRALLVLLVLAAGAVPLVAQSSFGAAVEAYDAGRFAEAADSFASHLRTRPFDAAAWYDLGNAAYRANAPGLAAHAWLRALWLEPRHGAARANLRLNMPAAAAAAPPRTLLGGRTALVIAAVAWWVALLAYAAHLLRPRPAWTWTIACTAVVALLALGLATWPHLGAADAVSLHETSLHPGPRSDSPAPERLQPGVPLDVLEESADWVRVRDPAGREGWIEARRAGRISTPSP
ncbi:MAG TPA: SH3 domain-containing protein, partial [Thermohalobaculum sp.]|nr:SH3 domain-containing protein [Thermohalobaculum sp.]